MILPNTTSLDGGVPFEMPPHIELLSTEYADNAVGMKMVFSGTREDGTVATFETGSFFDQTFDENRDPNQPDRHDICVSTAGGCTRSCKFCSVPDAELGFERLLTSEEIVFQVLYSIAARNPEGTIPNIVGLMGNGEPPDNIAVIPAVQELAQNTDANIGRITISTIGENTRNISKMADTFAELDMQTILQFSLHAADETKRRQIIPGRVPLANALLTADRYAEVTGEPVKYNVVLMQDSEGFTNATIADAEKLSQVLHAPSRVSGGEMRRLLKLSAYNPIPGKPYLAPSQDEIQAFVDVLRREGVDDIQWFLGSGIAIDAESGSGGFACGQLRATTANVAGSVAVSLSKKPHRREQIEQSAEQERAEWKAKRMVFIVGAHAAGKSTVTEAALTDGYAVFDIGPILEEEFGKDPIGGTFESWIIRSEAEYGEDFVSVFVARHLEEKLASGEIDHKNGIALIGARKPSVIRNIVERFAPSDSRTIWIEAPPETLYPRYNEREGGNITPEYFEAKLEWDRQMGTEDLKPMADVVIINDQEQSVDRPVGELLAYLDDWKMPN